MARNYRQPGPVTKALTAWDGKYTLEAVERVNALRIEDLGAHRSDGANRWRPSGLSNCERQQQLSYLGVKQTDESKGDTGVASLTSDGTEFHYYIQTIGLSCGFLDDIEVPFRDDMLNIAGQTDGVGSFQGPGYVFEAKNVHDQEFREIVSGLHTDRYYGSDGNPGPRYKDVKQVHPYMKGLGLERASIFYMSRSRKILWTEFVVEFDPGVYDEIDQQTNRLELALEQGRLMPMLDTCELRKGWRYDYCQWRSMCPTATVESR